MSAAGDVPAWAALLTAALVLLGGTLTLIGAVGLLRLGSFYERVHAPTLGTTLGAGCIAAASVIHFATPEAVLIAVFVAVTTPASLIVLVRAALFRDRAESADGVPGRDRL